MPEFLVRHLTAAEAQRDLHLVAFFEEALHRAHFHVVVMVVDHRPELDLLDLDDLLLFAGFGRLLLRLVLVLAVVQQLADRRGGIRGNLDQVKSGFLGFGQGNLDVGGSMVVTGLVDQLDFSDSDLLVDTRTVFLDGRRSSHGTTNGLALLCCCV